MQVYISGKISNNKHYKEDFDWMKTTLDNLPGIHPVSPIDLDDRPDKNHECTPAEWVSFMQRDIKLVSECGAIVMIGFGGPVHHSSWWKLSPGAKIERLVAKRLGIKVFYGINHFIKYYSKEMKYDGR